MSVPERALFVLLPLSALAAVAWLLAVADLPLALRADWLPAAGIDLAFRIDGLALLMLLMVSGIGTAVFVYAGGYMAGHPGQRRLYVLLTLFMLAMIGCVTADDVMLLFVFWELTSVTSFLLIGFHHERAVSRKSAQQALLVTGTGGLALLVGLILLAQIMGTGSISAIVERLPDTQATPLLVTALLLILVGAFTKSAQFPFHFWLPNAMSAPTPVSAYLHSATMVKLGVYLLARLDAGFGDWLLWQWLLQIAGSITAAWGMALTLRERDLKRILAWSTVAALGTLVTLIGLRGQGANVAVGALLIAHALYKAPLFFVAGNIDHAVGTRVIDHLGKLRAAMPLTAVAALLAGMSMAGIPLTIGYVVKDAITEAKAAAEALAVARSAITVFGAIAVAVAGVAAIRVFWHRPLRPREHDAHEAGAAMVLPPLVLATLGIVLGLAPIHAQPLLADVSGAMSQAGPAAAPVLSPAAGASYGSFALTFSLGIAVFLFWDRLHRLVDALARRLATFGMAAHYERSLHWIPRLAAASTRLLQHGQLPGYVMLIAGSAALGIAAALAQDFAELALPGWQAPSAAFAGACGVIVAGAVLAALVRDRLVLLLATGLVGYGSAVLFVFTGAPDVGYTQFAVEVVFVIVATSVLLVLRSSGRTLGLREPALRPRAALVAAAFATVVVALMLVTDARPFDATLSQYFLERSVPNAHGHNVVNVILVDFRALDTLGEIGVVLLSLLAALPLLRALRRHASAAERAAMQPPPQSMILDAVSRPLYWLILAASLWILLRGHDEPGGGFIAGLAAASASVLWAIAHGSASAAQRLPLHSPRTLAACGVLLALASGLPALFAGRDFLTHAWHSLPLGFTTLELSTVLLFDLGVYLCVWGALAGYALGLLEMGAGEEAVTP